MRNQTALLSVAEPWRSRRRLALELVRRVLAALDPYDATRESLCLAFPQGKRADSNRGVHVFALGKAAAPMARAALDELSPRSGFVLSPSAATRGLAPLVELQGGHPAPSADAALHAQRILAHLGSLPERDHLVCLVSGGGSALFELPRPGLSLEDLSHTSDLLMHAGADIQALNCVRRGLSQVKGGGLLRACPHLAVTNFILSDVVGGPVFAVASGPTLPVKDTYQSPLGVLEHFGVRSAVPRSVIALLEADRNSARPSSDMPGRSTLAEQGASPPSAKIPAVTPPTWLVADNARGVRLLKRHARTLGFELEALPGQLTGEAAESGERLAARIRNREATTGIAWGGETTVRIQERTHGFGGRNQELILGAARSAIQRGGFPGTLVSFGSDGVDGQSPAAGAVLDGATLIELDLGSIEHALSTHDSFTLLDRANATLVTGPTGTNVADLSFWLPD